MQTFKFNRSETLLFEAQHNNLVYNQESLLPFISRVSTKKNVYEQTNRKSFSQESREVLYSELTRQYQGIELHAAVQTNIDLLRSPDTFTITTGHQLSLFTGPLYFVIKVLHVIKQCEEMKTSFPDKHFVPVYWMASEDHDFEEIKSIELFNKSISWESNQKGPVGRFAMDAEIEQAKEAFKSYFQNGDKEIHELIDSLEGKTYGHAFRKFVNRLFESYGLVMIDGDAKAFKESFKFIMKDELLNQFAMEKVKLTTAELIVNGGKVQVNPREINLFYIEDGLRERVTEIEKGTYHIEGKGSFSVVEIEKLLNEKPENFSPNVILRPVYQELILPNILYVGGGGELSYWLQLKRVFDHCEVPYPLIQVRNSILWIDANTSAKIAKFDLLLEDLFKDEHVIKKEYVEENEVEALDFQEFSKRQTEFIESLRDVILKTDPSLIQYSDAEIAKLNNQIESIRAKLVKVSKGKHEGAMNAIEQIKSKLFPGNGLQERKSNFFNFCMKGNVTERLSVLYSAIEPFEQDLIVMRETT